MRGTRLISLALLPALLATLSTSEAGAGIETPRCRIAGSGTIATGDEFEGDVAGDVEGDESTFTGDWTHVTTSGSVIGLVPDLIFCRINGAILGDVEGSATIDGTGGYRLRLSVQDHRRPDDGDLVEGPTETHTLVATRNHGPTSWEDDSLDIDGRAIVTVPTELDVVEGSAGHGWARLSFLRHPSGDEVTCRYRGDSSADRYVLAFCTGEDAGTEEVEGGERVDVTSMTLHVQTGGPPPLSSGSTRTTVEASLEVTPLVPGQQRPDHYRITVIEGETLVFHVEADLLHGDIDVVRL